VGQHLCSNINRNKIKKLNMYQVFSPMSPIEPICPFTPFGPVAPTNPPVPAGPVAPVAPVGESKPSNPRSPSTPFCPYKCKRWQTLLKLKSKKFCLLNKNFVNWTVFPAKICHIIPIQVARGWRYVVIHGLQSVHEVYYQDCILNVDIMDYM